MHGIHLPLVIVVGAGLVGCLTAILLPAQGRRVCVVDQRTSCADVFWAEPVMS
jgi:2-polyprenyl-6-methoxyphenol hydroxylase-like FAD-dependent oxidoreductase